MCKHLLLSNLYNNTLPGKVRLRELWLFPELTQLVNEGDIIIPQVCLAPLHQFEGTHCQSHKAQGREGKGCNVLGPCNKL